MLLVPCADGHVAVAQPAHGHMCGQLARAWGNDVVGSFAPWEEVCLAAEQHDTGWAEWELHPTLDPTTGLPHTFDTAPFTVHLAIHEAWSRALTTQSRYAALLVSLHHASFFQRPGALGRLRDGGRRIEAFLDALAELQRELRADLGLAPDDPEVARNQRLVRTWDGLSHDVLLGLAPRVRRDVPVAGVRVDLAIERDGDAHLLEPWPFAADEVSVRCEGRLLRGIFANEAGLHAALAAAERVELRYELRSSAASRSAS